MPSKQKAIPYRAHIGPCQTQQMLSMSPSARRTRCFSSVFERSSSPSMLVISARTQKAVQEGNEVQVLVKASHHNEAQTESRGREKAQHMERNQQPRDTVINSGSNERRTSAERHRRR